MRRAWKAFALVAALSMTLAACASGDGGDGVASLGGDEGTGEASASPSVDPEEALAEFGDCMRENGIEDFEDPVIGEDGGIQIGVGGPAEGSDGPPSEEDREELQQAMEACNDLLPQDLGPGGDISEEDQAAMQDALLEFAQCMRDHGIDFPDPEFTDGGAMQQIGDGVDPNDPEFQEAEEACGPIMDDVRPGGGPPESTTEGGSDEGE